MQQFPTISRLSVVLAAGAILLSTPSVAVGQNATFTPYSGYRLGGSLSIREGDLKLDNGPFFGGQLDFRMRPDATAAILVDYQPTTLRLKDFGEPSEELFDLNVWYFQAGGTLEFLNQSDAVPFVIGSLGMSWFDPGKGGEENDSEYGFAGIFGVGAKVPLRSGGMGLRFQARVLLNNVSGGSSLWCGTGGGCYVGVGGPIGPVQFDFGGGLTFGGR